MNAVVEEVEEVEEVEVDVEEAPGVHTSTGHDNERDRGRNGRGGRAGATPVRPVSVFLP